AMNVFDCQEFWDILLYLGGDKINDKDLPHCTKMTKMILEEFWQEQKKIHKELQ
ncbi:hypothetical protein DXG03_005096, partial [Asterophora parasitica]